MYRTVLHNSAKSITFLVNDETSKCEVGETWQVYTVSAITFKWHQVQKVQKLIFLNYCFTSQLPSENFSGAITSNN